MNMYKKHKESLLLTVGTAVILLLCIATFWTISSPQSPNHTAWNFMRMMLLNFPLCVGIAAFDLWLTRRTARIGRLLPLIRLIINVVVSSIVIVAASAIANLILTGSLKLYFTSRLLPGLLIGFIILICIELYGMGQRHADAMRRLAESNEEKARYQYEALKNQISPHFLFNCLNVIASLAYEDAEKTNIFTKRLSSVYRYLLTTKNLKLVAVEEELKFVRDYVMLQQTRFENALCVTFDESSLSKVVGLKIVPASVQMSVENAIKHNRVTSEHPLQIAVKFDGANIIVENNINRQLHAETTGTGLDNLHRQYANLGCDIKISETESTYSISLPCI